MDHARGVIEFREVSKLYPGADAPSISRLTMRIESGQICALVGPSGSGKTTAMRMVNRLHEPTSGTIMIDGVDNRSVPLESLRRSIGYVIQQVGLFPHRTVLENVGTVPQLLGWDEHRIRARSRELLDLMGLDPSKFGDRYPTQLSGGQRQRVGVARALAADPPVMLMDEPFGAVDPLVREQIQDEFLRMQRDISKTIIIVTHDLDEAMRMGDKVAVLQEGGILAQLATPEELLAHPANEFVQRFVGGDSTLRRLGLAQVRQLPLIPLDIATAQGFGLFVDAAGQPVCWANHAPVRATVSVTATLRSALGELVAVGEQYAPVVDELGRPIAIITTALLHGWLERPLSTATFDAPRDLWHARPA
ncbi:MAG: proV: glycine betaine/L-proline transport binding subunit [Thermoleophilia bacterium]|nr:proV: glycine betaine/L-proline transport binding subunit [Thermoleophilia bacterium]